MIVAAILLAAFNILTVQALTPLDADKAVCIMQTNTCFYTIQEAINNAVEGQTVTITDEKIYKETVVINKGVILTSNSEAKPTVFSDSSSAPITITSDNVIISNLITLYQGRGIGSGAITVLSSNNITITNNTINNTGVNNGNGLYLLYTNSSNIADNIIHSTGGNSKYGLYLQTSSRNTITNNTLSVSGTGNSNRGIGLVSNSNSNYLSSNFINAESAGCCGDGIYLIQSSSNNMISNNTVYVKGKSDTDGIAFYTHSNNSTVISNTISVDVANDLADGIVTAISHKHTILHNIITLVSGGSDNAGINVGTLGTVTDSTFSYNNISARGVSKTYGIFVRNTYNSVFSFNDITAYCTGNENNGFYIDSTSNSNNSFISNSIICDTKDPSLDTIHVNIDVKPWSSSNTVKCVEQDGAIPVGIFSEDGFDAQSIDVSTVDLEGISAKNNNLRLKDLDGDGDLDAVVRFKKVNICELAGGLASQSIQVTLSGKTIDGQKFDGTDTIRIVKR